MEMFAFLILVHSTFLYSYQKSTGLKLKRQSFSFRIHVSLYCSNAIFTVVFWEAGVWREDKRFKRSACKASGMHPQAGHWGIPSLTDAIKGVEQPESETQENETAAWAAAAQNWREFTAEVQPYTLQE